MKPPPPDFETGDIWTPEGIIPHVWWERYCICRESGMSDQEARRVAAQDYARIQGEQMGALR